ncbi:MAG: helix-hairpin-helix domain-containing protein [Desulfotalea sp.]
MVFFQRSVLVLALLMVCSLGIVSVSANEVSPEAKEIAQNMNAPININNASHEQLVSLPGIGDKTADSILNYRTENGNFTSVDHLTNVKGIGSKKLMVIKPLITI